MGLIQILDCSDIGSCCTDYGLVAMLDTGRRIVSLVQLIVPIILMIMVTWQLIRMMMNPDDKKSPKVILNKVIAAAIIFFIPMIFDISVGVFPDHFSFTSCWNTAKTMREISNATNFKYAALSEEEVFKIVSGDEYEKGVPKQTGGGGGSAAVAGVGAQRMVNVALGELGTTESGNAHHKYEAFSGLSDYDPWCAAFVTWVGGQAGFLDQNIMPRFTACYFPSLFAAMGNKINYEGSGYNPVAGDLIFYTWSGNPDVPDHVGIVLSYDSDYVYTVEGNTNCDNSSLNDVCLQGVDGVYKKARSRHNGTIIGYATPNYPS